MLTDGPPQARDLASTRAIGDTVVSIYSTGTAFIGDAWAVGQDVVQGFNGMCIRTREAVVVVDPIFYPRDQTSVGPTESPFENGLPLAAALPRF
jgi:hypothetical protein